MLMDNIKKDARTKIFSLGEGNHTEGASLLCTGYIKRILSDTELTMVNEDKEYEMKKNMCYIMYIVSYDEVFKCSVYCRSCYEEEEKKIHLLEIVSPFEKVQRRKHHRVSCHSRLAVEQITLEQLEMQKQGLAFEKEENENNRQDEKFEDSIVDISGGGIRFTSKRKVQKNDYLSIQFYLMHNGEQKLMRAYGQVVYAGLFGNEEDCYDIRMKYVGLSELHKEQIIRFVFQLERENQMAK